MLAANEILGAKVLAATKVGNIEGDGRLKCIKPKIGRLESQKLFKSKKPSKSRNSPKFDAKENGPNFLTPGAREVFNRL